MDKNSVKKKLNPVLIPDVHTLLEAIPNLAWIAHADGFIFWYNQRWYDYTGTEPQDMEGWGWKSVHDPAQLPSVLERWQACIASGEMFEMEFPLKGADGQFRWFMTRVLPMRNSDKQITHWFGTNTDIHNQKLASDRVRASEAKFKYIYESSMFGIIFWNAAGDITDANDKFLEMLGYSRQELAGGKVRWSELTPSEFSDLDQKALEQVASHRVCNPYEKEFFRKDGTRLPIYIGAAFLEGSDDSGLCYIVDLTDKKKSEQQIRESQTRLETVLNHAPLVLWATDLNGTVTYSDGKGLDGLGLKPGQLIGQSVFDLYKDQNESLSALKRALDGESFSMESTSGSIMFDSHYSPLRDSAGHVQGMVGLSIDVSARKKSESERNAALLGETSARQASEMKSNFLATMSHEIRTPINGVIGMTGLLLDTSLQPEQKEYAEAIRNCADNLLNLINDILDFSKIESGKIDLEIVDFNLDHLIKEVERSLVFSAKKKGIKLYRSIVSEAPSSIYRGDPSRLRQVLVNLISNAIKFTEKGQVNIEVSQVSETAGRVVLKFEVSDTGIGIPASLLHRMFQAFSQADSSTSRKFGGTGLGLSISKKLVNLLGGEIGVVSEEGRGSSFWFTLPLEIGNHELKRSSEDLPTPILAGEKRLRILLAEDNTVNQTIATKMLQKCGYYVDIVANGNEVLNALQSAPYDLILMDCQMPEMDGYEATKRIRSSRSLKYATIPIVAMTANAMLGDREKCIEAGMNEYVSKPIRLKDLHNMIEAVVQRVKQAS